MKQVNAENTTLIVFDPQKHNTVAPVEIIEKKTLTDEERKELAEHEKVIQKAIDQRETLALIAGKHLLIIKEKKLYWEQFPDDFQGYVRARFKRSPRTGEYWMNYAENVQLFEHEGLPAPKTPRENMIYAPLQKEPAKLVKLVRWIKEKSDSIGRKFKKKQIAQLAKAAAIDDSFLEKRNSVSLSADEHKERIQEAIERVGELTAKQTTTGDTRTERGKDNGQKDRGGHAAPRRRSNHSPTSLPKVGKGEMVCEVTESYVRQRIFQIIVPQGAKVTKEIIHAAMGKIKDKQLGEWHEKDGSAELHCDKVDKVSPEHPVTRLTDVVRL
jgi:hypothetical protein